MRLVVDVGCNVIGSWWCSVWLVVDAGCNVIGTWWCSVWLVVGMLINYPMQALNATVNIDICTTLHNTATCQLEVFNERINNDAALFNLTIILKITHMLKTTNRQSGRFDITNTVTNCITNSVTSFVSFCKFCNLQTLIKQINKIIWLVDLPVMRI